ncbi:MAG: flagellar biosynthesis regulator FlaF [Rhodospirillales bacterium]|jgi:flagellar protein FlaF
MIRRPDTPYGAYGRAQGSALSLRQADSLAFSQAANLLEACCGQSRPDVEAALKRNLRLWTQVQRLLVPDSHPLPISLRANLLSLSLFVDRQTVKALISGSAADVRPLIDINREVALGLLG